MIHWRRLDMRSKNTMPPIGTLTALRLIPNNGRADIYCEEKYDIGRFRRDDGGRKAWRHGSSGTRDLAKMRAHYDIWWCPVYEFDGI